MTDIVAARTNWDQLPSVFRALRHRNFRLFMCGQLISLIGTWMNTVGEQWLVYRLTGSPSMLGLVGFAGQIPTLLLGPLAGSVADRMDRHKLILITQCSFMSISIVLSTLTLTGRIHIWEVFALASCMGIVNAFDVPARQSFVVEMTSKDDLMNAIALNSSMFNASRIVGPAIAGLVVAWVGEGWCFASNAVSYLAVIAGLLMMHVVSKSRTEPNQSALTLIRAGFQFAIRTPPIRALLLMTGITSLLGTCYGILMPIFANKILGGGAEHLGVLMCATGLGALCGALTLATRLTTKGLGRWVATASLGFGTSLALFSLSRTYWLSVLLLVPVGYGMMVQMGSTNTLLQAMVPDNMRGRVMSLYSTMFMGMMPIGSLVSGTLAEHIGAPWTVRLGGLGCCGAGILFAIALPALSEAARPLLEAAAQADDTVHEAVGV